MSNDLSSDLNAIIAQGVNARVEAAVLEALSADNFTRAAVTAALTQEVSTDRYSSKKETYLHSLLGKSIEEVTKAVVAEEIASQKEVIRNEVRIALTQSIGVITDSLVDGFVANASGKYPSIKVVFGSDN